MESSCLCSVFKDKNSDKFKYGDSDKNNEADKLREKGLPYHPNGTIEYEGEWDEGDRHGNGVSFHPDGKVEYDGGWRYDKYHGKGVRYNSNGAVMHDGMWEYGKFVG